MKSGTRFWRGHGLLDLGRLKVLGKVLKVNLEKGKQMMQESGNGKTCMKMSSNEKKIHHVYRKFGQVDGNNKSQYKRNYMLTRHLHIHCLLTMVTTCP